MKNIIIMSLMIFALSGCTGVITGHEYSKDSLVIMYKVVKNGVITFMTPEEIEAAKLDKLNIVVTDSYKLVTPEELAQENLSKPKK